MISLPNSRLASLCVLTVALTVGCNSSQNQASQDNKLIGAGSTFINPIMTHWIADFQSAHAGGD